MKSKGILVICILNWAVLAFVIFAMCMIIFVNKARGVTLIAPSVNSFTVLIWNILTTYIAYDDGWFRRKR